MHYVRKCTYHVEDMVRTNLTLYVIFVFSKCFIYIESYAKHTSVSKTTSSKRLIFKMLNRLNMQLRNIPFRYPKVSLCNSSTYLVSLIWVLLLCSLCLFVQVVEYLFDICSEIVSCWEHRVFFTLQANLLAYILKNTVQCMYIW